MSTNDKIKSGLAARDRAKSGGGTFNLDNLKGAPVTVGDLQELANKATSKRDRLKELSSGIVNAVEAHKEKKKAEYAELGKTREGNIVRDELGDNRRRTMLEREVNAYARNARKISAEERFTLAQELRDITTKLEATKGSLTDPVALLSRKTLSDPKRAVYYQNLANAGPVAVESALRDAVLTGDHALAAAAIDRLDAMPKGARKLVRLRKQDIAESLVAEELAKASEYITMAEIAVSEGELANSEAEGSRATPQQKIALGLKKAN